MWMSEWQTPQKRISICTSFGLSARRSIWKGARGVFGPWAAYALVNDISTMGGVDREEFWSAEGYARRHTSAIRGQAASPVLNRGDAQSALLVIRSDQPGPA